MTDKRYLFRGFHPDENGKTVIKLNGEKICGEWIYGSLIGLKVNKKILKLVVPLGGWLLESPKYEVISETVGQWVTT